MVVGIEQFNRDIALWIRVAILNGIREFRGIIRVGVNFCNERLGLRTIKSDLDGVRILVAAERLQNDSAAGHVVIALAKIDRIDSRQCSTQKHLVEGTKAQGPFPIGWSCCSVNITNRRTKLLLNIVRVGIWVE